MSFFYDQPVLVTGATGFIGSHIARGLAEAGARVRVLVRPGSQSKTGWMPAGERWELAPGDLLDPSSLDRAMAGMRYLFHVAGDYRFWAPDLRTIEANNIQGTAHVLDAAAKAGVERIVYTSTPAILAGRPNGALADERELASPGEMPGAYKRSKFRAYLEVEARAKKGVPVITVMPTAPIGSGDVRPTPTGRIVVCFANGKIPFVARTGLNFVDVKAAAMGHLQAAMHGRLGERYLVGGENLSLQHFFQHAARWLRRPIPRMICPHWVSLTAAAINDVLVAPLTRREPFVTREAVRMSRRTHFFTSAKAEAELGYTIGNLDAALREAVQDFSARGLIRRHCCCESAAAPAFSAVGRVVSEG